MSQTQHGGPMGDLFTPADVPHTRDDGVTIWRCALRCRWCFATVDVRDLVDVFQMPHQRPCRVDDLVETYHREGNTAAVVTEYDAVVAALAASERTNQR
jgi:hypothetical protein